MKKYRFGFWATRFTGMDLEDPSRHETVKISAKNFSDAIDKLKEELHNFAGSNSFEHFTVATKNGIKSIKTNPVTIFDIHGIARDATFRISR